MLAVGELVEKGDGCVVASRLGPRQVSIFPPSHVPPSLSLFFTIDYEQTTLSQGVLGYFLLSH